MAIAKGRRQRAEGFYVYILVRGRFGRSICPNLASDSDDETIRLWSVKTWECLNVLKVDRPYEGMTITGVSGLSEAAIANLKALGAIEEN